MTNINPATSFLKGAFRMIPSARKTLAALLAAAMLAALPARALSVEDFEARTNLDQTNIIVAFVDKMTADLGHDNPQLAKGIHDYFFRTPQGERYSEGLWNLEVELAALENVAKSGKVDLSKIQIEGVIFKVVKDKFPPQK